MPLQTWSGLQKSSTDDQTIEEAIIALVASHNADPTAHGDAGEALDLHKTNAVIDHPAGSLKGDKVSNNEIILDIPFQSLDGIEASSNVAVNLGQGITVDMTSGSYLANYFYIVIPGTARHPLEDGKDWTMQWAMQVDDIAGSKFRLGPEYYSGTTPHGLVFSYDGTNLKAVSTLTGYTYTSSSITFDPSHYHIYRIDYSTIDHFVRWYIDGLQVASFDLTGHTGGIADSMNFEFDYGSSSAEPFYSFPKFFMSKAL